MSNDDIKKYLKDMPSPGLAAIDVMKESYLPAIPDTSAMLGLGHLKVHDRMEEALERFRLPRIAEIPKLSCDFEKSGVVQAIAYSQELQSQIESAMEAMRVPWLDTKNEVSSISGFVELQRIGHALRNLPAFDTGLADRLRVDLGDWRDKITWPPDIFADPLARSTFYTERGFDANLTAFPVSAFNQSASIAGIKAPLLSDTAHYTNELIGEEDKEKAGFARNNAAHDQLQQLEFHTRKFIDDKMTAAFGENWVKHQIPSDMREEWYDKLQKAKDNGEIEQPLISYADFTDYVRIIMRKDNWGVFRSTFRRPQLVQESFQRLFPIRICTMHARIITQDDLLYLYAETRRLLSAIGNES